MATQYAVPGNDIRTLRTTDLSLARGPVEIRRGLLRHIVHLEEFQPPARYRVAGLLPLPLAGFHQPALAGQQEDCRLALQEAVGIGLLLQGVLPRGVAPEGLRQDGTEALETADPLKLKKLFGIWEPRPCDM
ncbi:hypothetical protein AB0942_10420 [Streptomyces nodosus]|uniref:hypothetical protein n=1 Tax=Streptomyces nodosus TaxID=40318 RepID=UPI00345239EE